MRQDTPRLRALIPALLLACGAAGAAEPAPADPLPGQLIERLGDPDYGVRESSQRELRKLGVSAFRLLEVAAVRHRSIDVRDRSADLVAELRPQVEAAARLKPQLVALDYKDVPLEQAVADLVKRSGVNLRLEPGAGGRAVTVKSEAVPAWEAVERFRAQAGLREVLAETVPGGANPDGANRIYARRVAYYQAESPAQAATPSQVAVAWAAATAAKPALALAGDRRGAVRVQAVPGNFAANRLTRGSGEILIHLDVAPPAGVRWTPTGQVRLDRAEDDTGRPIAQQLLAPPAPQNPYGDAMFLGNGQVIWVNNGMGGLQQQWYGGSPDPNAGGPNPRLVPLTLRGEDRRFRTLRVLKGVVLGEVTEPDQPAMTLTLLPEAGGRGATGPYETSVTLVSYSKQADGKAVVRLRWEGPSQGMAQMRFNRAVPAPQLHAEFAGNAAGRSRYQFRDAKGRVLKSFSNPSNSGRDDGSRQSMEYELHFAESMTEGLPVTLTVLADKPVPVEVAFELKDVPLP